MDGLRIVFDLDGTLLRSSKPDSDAFERAYLEIFCVQIGRADVESCRHHTDLGIVNEMWERQRGRRPVDSEIAPLHDRFMAILSDLLPHGPALQALGASALLDELRRRGIATAIATGAWRASADLKIQRAELDAAGIPIATCDRLESRAAIVRQAISLLPPVGGRTVLVGDGPWDVACARELGHPFIGVDLDGADRMTRLGVESVVPDFTDLNRFLRLAERDARP